MCKAVTLKNAIFPLKEVPSWAEDLDGDLPRWLYRDVDCSENYDREDTRFFMHLCALRFAAVFEQQGISRKRYAFYWDEGSLDRIQVGIRHAAYVPDFGYGFDKSQMLKFTLASLERGDVRRQKMIAVCGGSVRRQADYFESESGDAILHDFGSLIRANKDENVTPSVEVSGAFSEVLRYIRELPVREVFAMGGYIHGDSNLFGNQLNFHIDVDSTWKFLQCVVEESIPLWFLPTECAKGDPARGIQCP